MKKKMANRFEPTIKNEEENNMNGIYEMATGAHASRSQQIENMNLTNILLNEIDLGMFLKGTYGFEKNSWLGEMKSLIAEAKYSFDSDECEFWKMNQEFMADKLEGILKEILHIENDIERDGYLNHIIFLHDYENINLECEIYEFIDYANGEYEI